MQKTNIEYLTHTWSPIAMRCTPVSSGCDHCWHLRMANRLYAVPIVGSSVQDAYLGHGAVMPDRWLSAPLRRKKPSIIGVQFMGDMFHDKVTNEMIAAVFGVMAACPQHTFIVLTKRPDRALKWFEYIKEAGEKVPFYVGENIPDGASGEAAMCVMQNTLEAESIEPTSFVIGVHQPWPLQNVLFGVSIEDQKTADERIPLLLKVPAAKRFVSYEPAIGPVDLRNLPFGKFGNRILDALTAGTKSETPWNLNWIICGAETGPHKRPMDLNLARSVRDQCKAASVPFFFKVDSDGNHTLDGVVHEDMP